jgi:ribosomal protein S12 methylthiotransferase accessory factor
VGELKGMLALHIGDYEQALEWVQWGLELAQFLAPREKLYQALAALLEIQLDGNKERTHYCEGLEHLYGVDTVQTCIALLEGREHYHGLFDAGMELKGLQRHQSLLLAYDKLQQAKRVAGHL